jgi:hypothetical protein
LCLSERDGVTSGDPTGSKNMAKQLQKFMKNDYNVSNSGV